MKKFKLSGVLALAFIVAGSLTLAGCKTTDFVSPAPKEAPDKLGDGSYLISHFPGIPAIDGEDAVPADPWSSTQFKQLQFLDYQCHLQLDRYIPSAAKEIASFATKEGIGAGIGGGVGTGLGAVASFTGVTFRQYFQYGGIASAFSGFGSGVVSASNQYRIAKSYVEYACMTGFVYRASQLGHLKGITPIPWAGTIWARQTEMPAGPPVADKHPRTASDEDASSPPASTLP